MFYKVQSLKNSNFFCFVLESAPKITGESVRSAITTLPQNFGAVVEIDRWFCPFPLKINLTLKMHSFVSSISQKSMFRHYTHRCATTPVWSSGCLSVACWKGHTSQIAASWSWSAISHFCTVLLKLVKRTHTAHPVGGRVAHVNWTGYALFLSSIVLL